MCECEQLTETDTDTGPTEERAMRLPHISETLFTAAAVGIYGACGNVPFEGEITHNNPIRRARRFSLRNSSAPLQPPRLERAASASAIRARRFSLRHWSAPLQPPQFERAASASAIGARRFSLRNWSAPLQPPQFERPLWLFICSRLWITP
ncbi:hypothetical protein BV898_10175 [Hypsibius exemplaris]|uniref:Uncharacterized protein n=1 Tax=Hypsibius exemplaris TaxID=2072580 RepID=A0A1W0WKK2_HYPEX|nr:hypothetical protein BV898_10175 [Hypsibius exemplaris]